MTRWLVQSLTVARDVAVPLELLLSVLLSLEGLEPDRLIRELESKLFSRST